MKRVIILFAMAFVLMVSCKNGGHRYILRLLREREGDILVATAHQIMASWNINHPVRLQIKEVRTILHSDKLSVAAVFTRHHQHECHCK